MRKLIVLAAVVLLVGSTTSARAEDEYNDYDSHPLLLLSYVLNPIGYSLEWLATRPIHELVRQPDLEPVFGHSRHSSYGDEPVGIAIQRNR